MIFTFSTTVIIGLIYKRIKNSNKTKKLPNPRGGKFIDQCVEPDSIYELVDPTLQIVVKRMIGLSVQSGSIIISPALLILAYIVSR